MKRKKHKRTRARALLKKLVNLIHPRGPEWQPPTVPIVTNILVESGWSADATQNLIAVLEAVGFAATPSGHTGKGGMRSPTHERQLLNVLKLAHVEIQRKEVDE